MFKKLSHISFAFLVLISTTGIIIPEHHCMGYIDGVVAELPNGGYCDPNQEMPPDCCKNELHCVWLDANYQSRTTVEVIAPIHQTIHIPAQENGFSQKNFLLTFTHDYYSPPPLIRDISLFEQVFLL